MSKDLTVVTQPEPENVHRMTNDPLDTLGLGQFWWVTYTDSEWDEDEGVD